jgi:hypothetical protein
MKFEGTERYVATEDLRMAVNAAVALQRPLLIKGEPGTGKTMLAEEVAAGLGMPLIQWHIKSTTKAQQGLYEYDAVSRLRDSQLGDDKVHDVRNYIKKGKLWEAFTADEQAVLLIDEVDKADIEFPNDLLVELDRMEFFVYETGETIKARQRPVIIITSNNEKGTARRIPAPLLFPLHQLPGSGHDAQDRRRALPGDIPDPGTGGAGGVLRSALRAGPEEEALHVGAHRLAQAADGGRYPRRDPARARPVQRPSRRSTVRCSRTSRTCICSSAWPSCTGGNPARGRALPC